jgi:DNA repair protein RadD
MKKPRPYQEDGIDLTFRYLAETTGDGLLGYPTGTGKSLIIAEICRRAVQQWPQVRILMVTHDKKLVRDNFEELIGQWPTAPAGINSAGLKKRQLRQITFATIGSIRNQAELLGHVNLVIVDEAHRVSPKQNTTYSKLFATLRKRNPLMRVVGLTATMYRMGQGLLTEGDKRLFTDVITDWTTMERFNQLLSDGYMVRLVPKRTGTELDVSGVRVQGGEFVLSELQLAVDREEITRAACEEAVAKASDRKHWLVFCAGIEHAEHTTDILNQLGLHAVCSHSKLPVAQQDEAERKFKSGEAQALVNNGQFTTGFNFPGIDCIVILRPTNSANLWVQILGRGTRPVWPLPRGENWHLWPQCFPDKFDLSRAEDRLACIAHGPKTDCLVLDFAANAKRLGPINDPKLPRAKGKGKGTAPVRVCEKCDTYNHASARVCECCGFEFPKIVKFGSVAAGDALIVGDAPQVEVFEVTFTSYRKNVPRDDRPPTLVASYTCGLRQFNEWICLEHSNFALHKAREWWRKRDDQLELYDVPTTVDEALSRCDDLLEPTHLRVWVNKKFPEILDADFSGTAFGTQPAPVNGAAPGKTRAKAPAQPAFELEDDDVPF